MSHYIACPVFSTIVSGSANELILSQHNYDLGSTTYGLSIDNVTVDGCDAALNTVAVVYSSMAIKSGRLFTVDSTEKHVPLAVFNLKRTSGEWCNAPLSKTRVYGINGFSPRNHFFIKPLRTGERLPTNLIYHIQLSCFRLD